MRPTFCSTKICPNLVGLPSLLQLSQNQSNLLFIQHRYLPTCLCQPSVIRDEHSHISFPCSLHWDFCFVIFGLSIARLVLNFIAPSGPMGKGLETTRSVLFWIKPSQKRQGWLILKIHEPYTCVQDTVNWWFTLWERDVQGALCGREAFLLCSGLHLLQC